MLTLTRSSYAAARCSTLALSKPLRQNPNALRTAAAAAAASAMSPGFVAPPNGASYSTKRDPSYRVLRKERMNKNVLEAQYAVRGAIPLRAEELRDQIEENGENHGLPFDKVVNCNIGNPQQLDQKPLTFLRQVRPCSLISRAGKRTPRSRSLPTRVK